MQKGDITTVTMVEGNQFAVLDDKTAIMYEGAVEVITPSTADSVHMKLHNVTVGHIRGLPTELQRAMYRHLAAKLKEDAATYEWYICCAISEYVGDVLQAPSHVRTDMRERFMRDLGLPANGHGEAFLCSIESYQDVGMSLRDVDYNAQQRRLRAQELRESIGFVALTNTQEANKARQQLLLDLASKRKVRTMNAQHYAQSMFYIWTGKRVGHLHKG